MISPATIDLRTVRTETPQNALFKITNNGPNALRILDIHTSCGCTVPSVSKVVAPGTTERLKVDYEPDLLSSGSREETITITTDNPLQKTLTVKLKAILNPPILLDPPPPYRANFTPGKEQILTIKARRRDNGPPPFTGAHVDSRRIQLLFKNSSEISQTTLRYGGSSSSGDIDESLHFEGYPGNPQLAVAFSAKVQNAPYVVPSIVRIRQMSAGTATRLATLSLFARPGKAKLLSVSSPDRHLAFKTKESGSRTWIDVDYLGGWAAGNHAATIRITSDYPTNPIVEVPLVAKVVD